MGGQGGALGVFLRCPLRIRIGIGIGQRYGIGQGLGLRIGCGLRFRLRGGRCGQLRPAGVAPCQGATAPVSGPPYGYEYPCGRVDPSGRRSGGAPASISAAAPALRSSMTRAAAARAPAR